MADFAIRVQFAVYDVLVAEAIVEPWMYGAFQPGGGITERWAMQRWREGKPIGCSIAYRADKPRYWDVPVGSKIP